MNWQARPLGPRALAAALALGATAALLLLMAGGERRTADLAPVRQPSVTLRLLPAAPTRLPQPLDSRSVAAVAPPPRAIERLRRGRPPAAAGSATPSDSPVQGVTTPPEPAATPIAEAAPAAASAPLKLDEATLRAADAHSLGLVRRLGEASGQALPGVARSGDERLRSAVAEAARPDCLAPNAHASLLAIPAIAFAALAGKCH